MAKPYQHKKPLIAFNHTTGKFLSATSIRNMQSRLRTVGVFVSESTVRDVSNNNKRTLTANNGDVYIVVPLEYPA